MRSISVTALRLIRLLFPGVFCSWLLYSLLVLQPIYFNGNLRSSSWLYCYKWHKLQHIQKLVIFREIRVVILNIHLYSYIIYTYEPLHECGHLEALCHVSSGLTQGPHRKVGKEGHHWATESMLQSDSTLGNTYMFHTVKWNTCGERRQSHHIIKLIQCLCRLDRLKQ